MNIKASAVICTFNRVDYLKKAIKSLDEQILPKEYYEIIIVDNGSTDDTKRVVGEDFSFIPNLRYIYEPIQGLSQARNTGWQNAKGEYVAYIDDDAVASKEWLGRIAYFFEKTIPQPGCVGGKIEPIWEAERPEWLADEMLGLLAIVDWSDTPIILDDKHWLAGANMAFSKSALQTLGGFKVNLGRKGDKLLSMEETILLQELKDKGYSCFYNPEVVVKHHIPASRLTKNWFIQRAYWNGVSSAIIQTYKEERAPLTRLWKGLTTLLRILFSPREVLCLIMPTDNPSNFLLKCSVLARMGHIFGLWGITR